MSKKIVGIQINPKSVLILFLTISVILVLLHMGFHFLKFNNGPEQLLFFENIFNVDNESSIPTWFSQIMLFLSAVLCWLIARSKYKLKEPYSIQWKIMSAIFLFLSIDEIAMFHERFLFMIGHYKSNFGLASIPTWYVYATPLIIFVFILLIRFWLKLPNKTKFMLVFSAAVYLFGAVFCDNLGGRFVGQGFFHTGFIIGIEELFEMIGTSLFIYTLCDYALSQRILVALSFDGNTQQSIEQ